MERDAEAYHRPVMVEEVLEHLEPERGGLYLDGTLGGGGHAEAILRRSPTARLMGVDRDPEAIEVARRRLEPWAERVTLSRENFADVAERLAEEGGPSLAGALLDLGVSSHQIDAGARGFSFRPGTPLDMRMGAGATAPTAADLLNTLDEAELGDIFRTYGEEKRARALAREVVRRRSSQPFAVAEDLVDAMTAVMGPRVDAQDRARIFQALRIAVNGELVALERALPALKAALEPSGVLVVISYHSLEDRRVKNAMRDWSRACTCPPRLPVCVCGGIPEGETLTRKVLFASEAEVTANPRARSARLRAWRKAA